MPLYEYECTACHRRTEKILKFSDPELTVCPFCGGPLERTITAPAFSFAGGGWYKDLYSSAKAPAPDTANAAAPATPSAEAAPAAAATAPATAPAPAAAPAPTKP